MNSARRITVGGLKGMVLLLGFALTSCAPAPATRTSTEIPQATKQQVLVAYGKLPMSFEVNTGQMDRQVQFVARGRGYTLLLAQDEAVFVLRMAKGEESPRATVQRAHGPTRLSSSTGEQSRGTRHRSREYEQTVLRMKLVGANPSPMAQGLAPLPGIVNYFIGRDPTKWRTNIPTYQKVEYKNIYDGIDLVYYGNQQQLEYDLVVSPGVDPKAITLAFEGMESAAIAADGDLVLRADGSEIRLRKPVAYQDHDGQRAVIPTRYVLKAEHQVAFEVTAYDTTKPLIIDPVLAYSTYLGGNSDDIGHGIAVDATGSAYVTGRTFSTNFPTTSGAFQTTLGPAFVTKLNADGSALVYSTFLSGGVGRTIAVDGAGNAYVTGSAGPDFPTTPGVVQPTSGGFEDAFVTKLNAAGDALVYSTFLGGGGGSEAGHGIAVDAAGNAYVTGETNSGSPFLPPGAAAFPTTPGAFQTTFGGGGDTDAFVTKLNATGSALVYSTYLGGDGGDRGNGIAVDTLGSAYVTGDTFSTNFPTTPGSFRETSLGGNDAFVTKLNPTGSALVYSTFLGGEGSFVDVDFGRGIAVDANGSAYVTGETHSLNFPTTLGAVQTTFGGSRDAFVTKLNATGSALVYSTYLGGGGGDEGNAIAVDATGSAYVAGRTLSHSGFPTTPDAVDTTDGQVFVTKLNATGAALVYSTLLGGFDSSNEGGNDITVDAAGSAYVTGRTNSPNFPTTLGAFQTIFGGQGEEGIGDAFVAKFSFGNTPVGANVTVPLDPVTATFENVSQAGDTTLTTSAEGPSPPTGFKLGVPPTYYDLTTTAQFSGSVTICINYAGIVFGDEASLKLSHFEGQNWVDATPISLDNANNIICGSVNSLSPFAIFEPAIQSFATFRPEVEIKLPRGANNDTFEVEAFFALSAGAGIAPLNEDLTLVVGPYSTTIPAGSFKQKKGGFKFKGVIDGVRLAAKIRPSRSGGFKFEAVGRCANLDGTVNPLTVGLTIGNDRGSTNVRAEMSSRSQRGKCGERRDDDKDDNDDKGDKDDD